MHINEECPWLFQQPDAKPHSACLKTKVEVSAVACMQSKPLVLYNLETQEALTRVIRDMNGMFGFRMHVKTLYKLYMST